MAVAEQERSRAVRAQARWVHSSARKARLVTDLIRGRSVPEARTILAFSNRAVAKDVEKVLRSAVANAESRPDLHWHGDELVIAAAFADEGPTLKRWRARARGRVARIRKRTCHITIELAQGAPRRGSRPCPRWRREPSRSKSRRPSRSRRRSTRKRLPRSRKPSSPRRPRSRKSQKAKQPSETPEEPVGRGGSRGFDRGE